MLLVWTISVVEVGSITKELNWPFLFLQHAHWKPYDGEKSKGADFPILPPPHQVKLFLLPFYLLCSFQRHCSQWQQSGNYTRKQLASLLSLLLRPSFVGCMTLREALLPPQILSCLLTVCRKTKEALEQCHTMGIHWMNHSKLKL